MQPARLGALASCLVAAILGGPLLSPSPARAQIVVETPQRANERIREFYSNARVIPHDYVIGNGDVIDIDVFDVKELSRQVRVSQTGSIGIPLVPVRLRVAGLTELQAEQKIAEVLETDGLVSHPEVSVNVKERRSKPITVVGAVAHPLVFQADHPVSVLEVLAEAGGIANDAGDTVIVTRPSLDATEPSDPPSIGTEDHPLSPSQKDSPKAVTSNTIASTPSISGEAPRLSNTITINLNELVENGNTTNNILLQAGDTVTVPHAGIVYVLGAVSRPGGFVLANDRSLMTTLKVLALAGGLNNTAKSDHAVIIRRDPQGQQHEVQVDLKKVQKRETEDVQLLPSDILFVPNSGSRQAMLKAAELGIALGSGIALYRLAYH